MRGGHVGHGGGVAGRLTMGGHVGHGGQGGGGSSMTPFDPLGGHFDPLGDHFDPLGPRGEVTLVEPFVLVFVFVVVVAVVVVVLVTTVPFLFDPL